MSIYYKQNFVSAEPLYAEVKEELRSYFAAGVIDDVMFPKWTEHCLKRFRKSAFKITEQVIDIADFQGELPCDFKGVREAWMCTIVHSRPIQDASAQYYQKDCRVDIPILEKCDACFVEAGTCSTDYLVTHKITNTVLYSFRRTFLLRPANISTLKWCGDCCPNVNSQQANTFDIHDNKIITNFCEGKVHLIYYATPSEEEQMVPDDFWIQDYIRKNLIYQCFRQLCNTITDETYNQIEKKKITADAEQSTALILAETELKKQTSSEKIRQIGVLNRRNNDYRLPGDRSYLNNYDSTTGQQFI